MGAELNPFVPKLADFLPAEQGDFLAGNAIPAIGAAYLIRDQEDSGRKAITSQQRPGVREKVEVAIIKVMSTARPGSGLFASIAACQSSNLML